jgi:hypothetical protein
MVEMGRRIAILQNLTDGLQKLEIHKELVARPYNPIDSLGISMFDDLPAIQPILDMEPQADGPVDRVHG